MLINKLIEDVVEKHANVAPWPKYNEWRNRKTGRKFTPQNEAVYHHIFETDEPRHLYFKSGEGAGKTATLSVLILNKLRRGLSGAFVCVDLPMLIKVWQEFSRWIPWDCVVPEHRHMASEVWMPYRSVFEIVFYSELGDYSKLTIGGLGDNYGKWESLNLNFFAGDEWRHVPNDGIMKIATGRIRERGPRGEPPQLIVGSTPTDKSHWLFDYFGPLGAPDEVDPLRPFKLKSKVINLSVEKNLDNIDQGYYEDRSLTLTEKERAIFRDGEWGDLSEDTQFLESMSLWDRLYDPTLMPPHKKDDPNKYWADALVVGLDAGIKHDSFAIVAVSRNPKNRNDVAVRLVRELTPKHGKIDFTEAETIIRDWCTQYNVVTIVFDPYQLYDMTERLRREGIAWLQEFSQQSKRVLADTQLYELILGGRLAHNGDTDLRRHVNQADFRYDARAGKKRITKRRDTLRVDLLVALSQASYECLRLNL